MTSNHHAPYDLGYTRATMDRAEGSEAARWSETHKTVLSSDCSLQLDCTKMESLVIANQHVAVNTFPGLVHTARHTMGVGIEMLEEAGIDSNKVRIEVQDGKIMIQKGV